MKQFANSYLIWLLLLGLGLFFGIAFFISWQSSKREPTSEPKIPDPYNAKAYILRLLRKAASIRPVPSTGREKLPSQNDLAEEKRRKKMLQQIQNLPNKNSFHLAKLTEQWLEKQNQEKN